MAFKATGAIKTAIKTAVTAMNRKRIDTRLLAILLLALALRLALWAQPLHEPANDETEYIAVAYDLLEGRGWEFYNHYHWLRAPLYPLFLAGSLWLTQGNLHLAALPNILLSVATVGLVYLLARLLNPTPDGSRAPPLLAALCAALLFTFGTFASLYMSETLFSFLFTAALVVLLWWAQQGHRRGMWVLVLAGVLYGLATLTRSVTLAFAPLVALWLVLVAVAAHHHRRLLTLRVLWPAVLFGLSVGCTIAPWTLRNCQAYGRCILVETGLSFNLWAFSEPHEDRAEIFRVLESIPNPAERADEATRRGMERLREDPTILLRKPWPNWVALWRVKPIQDRFLLPTYYADPPPLVFLGALLLDDALYLLVLVAGVVGLHMLLAHPRTRLYALLPTFWVLYIIGTTMMTHGEGRYRHFVFPVLIVAAAIATLIVMGTLGARASRTHAGKMPAFPGACLQLVSDCYISLTRLRRAVPHIPRTVPGIAAIAVSGTLVLVLLYTVLTFYDWEWAAEGAARSTHRLVGDVANTLGNEHMAEAAYLRAYAADKTADGRLVLGDLYLAQGRIAEAEEQYRSGWERKRRYVGATARLGDVLRRQGHDDEARDAFAGYFVAEQAVTDWSWEHLEPPPAREIDIDVGNGLDFGFVGNVYNAEEEQGASVRWTNGTGLVRVAGGEPGDLLLVRVRMAAPHPGREQVPARLCSGGLCVPVPLARTWRTVMVMLPATGEQQQVIELHSPTFDAPDGRTLGVLLDRVDVVRLPASNQHHDQQHQQNE